MIQTKITVGAGCTSGLYLGRQGENEARRDADMLQTTKALYQAVLDMFD